MILGIGIDIIEIERIKQAHQQRGDRFLKRLFTLQEQTYCFTFQDPYPHLAARFAAKEAVSKALGTGIGRAVGWTDIEVRNHHSGQPYVILSAKAKSCVESLGGSTVLLSLAHSRHHAVAVAIIV